jgi:hypothetical protein
MEYVSVTVELCRLEAKGDYQKRDELLEILGAFPDLRIFRDCWGVTKLCSAEANDQVDVVEFDSCSKCQTKPVKAWSYVAINSAGRRLYSDPPYSVVAYQNQNGFGHLPVQGVEDRLKDLGLDRYVIGAVREHQFAHPPINYLGVDDVEQAAGPGNGTGADGPDGVA